MRTNNNLLQKLFYEIVIKIGENTILILTFWGHSQFSPYILITVNLVPTVNSLTKNTYVANSGHS